KAEAQGQQRVGHLGMLIETGSHADGVGEVEPKGAHRQPRIIARRGASRSEFQRPDGKRMGLFWIERPQQRPGQAFEKADQCVLQIKAARTLSAMTAFFKEGLDRTCSRL